MLKLEDLLDIKVTATIKEDGDKVLAVGIRFVRHKDKKRVQGQVGEAFLFLVFYKKQIVSQSVFLTNAIEVYNMTDKELAKLAEF